MRALLLLSLLGASARAAADDEREQSRAHFRAGTAFFDEGDYDRAIKEYEEAYRLLPLPEFLFDLGQANRLKGYRERALGYYRQYLEKKPDSRFSEEARARVRELEAQAAPAPPLGHAGEPARAPRPWYKSAAGWALAGGGVVLEGVGVGLFVNANALDAQIPNAPSLTRAAQLQQDRDAYRAGGAAVCAIGGAAIVAGVVLLALGAYRGRHAPR